MTFGERLKAARKEKGMSQKELAELIGTTPRSVINYEKGTRLPQNIDIVMKISKALDVPSDYLMSGDDEFVIKSGELYGPAGKRQAKAVLENAAALFAGGELDDEEMLSFMTRIQTIYLDSKKKAKKFSGR